MLSKAGSYWLGGLRDGKPITDNTDRLHREHHARLQRLRMFAEAIARPTSWTSRPASWAGAVQCRRCGRLAQSGPHSPTSRPRSHSPLESTRRQPHASLLGIGLGLTVAIALLLGRRATEFIEGALLGAEAPD